MATSDTRDLWYASHDAYIRRIHTNAAAANAVLAVESFHLNEFYGFPDGSEIEIRFTDVEELSVLISRQCGAARRFESASWTQFESAFSDERGTVEQGKYWSGRYEILQAHATFSVHGIVLVIDDIVDYAGFAMPDADFLTEIKIDAMNVEVQCPDGATCSLVDFISRGEAYWRQYRS